MIIYHVVFLHIDYDETEVEISVTFRFTQDFLTYLGTYPKYSLTILAARTVNVSFYKKDGIVFYLNETKLRCNLFQELNTIFKNSKTKIKFKLHCIMPIDIADKVGLNLEELLKTYNDPGKLLSMNPCQNY